jgi:hypothetical protein
MRLVAPLPGQGGSATLYSTGTGGLRESADGCQTWKDVPSTGLSPSGASIRWLATHLGNNDVLYAGMDGLGGLYRSVDGGATWQPARGLPAGAWVTALTSDPERPERILLGVKYATRYHPPAYIFGSTDGGVTWRSTSLGLHLLPNNGGEIVSLTWAGDTLFAATASDGLHLSTDRGESWQPATMPRTTAASAANALAGAPTPKAMPPAIKELSAGQNGVLVLNTLQGAYRSGDGGRSWESFGPGEAGSRIVVGLDRASGRVALGDTSGMWTHRLQQAEAAMPTATPQVISQAEPTQPPPPQLPTNTPLAPTATPVPPTATAIARPPGWLPSDRAQPEDPEVSAFFEQTGHNVKFGFRDYWFNNDGVSLLGYPLTEEFVENGIPVQYFERARLEYRDGKIGWGLVGRELTEGEFFRPVRFFPSEDDNVYFGPTQHSVSGPFLEFWRDNGGLETFGYPLSESFKEDGSEYQWFERARFEWHPFMPEGERIVLGLIGKEVLQKRGWIK